MDLGVKVKDTDAEAAARIEAGALVINNIQFADAPAGLEITDYIGANQSFYTQGVNSGAGNGASSPDWAAGWTVGLDNSGPSGSENLAGEITGDVTLDASIDYQLTSAFVVQSGASLPIPAGTTIRATG